MSDGQKWIPRGKARGMASPKVWHADRKCYGKHAKSAKAEVIRETKPVSDEDIALRGLRPCRRCAL